MVFMNLVQRINQAARAVGALKPDKTNTFQSYNYISADKILQKCGDALANAGVLVLPSIVNQEVATYTGGNKIRYDATVEFIFTVTDGATEFRAPWVGMGVATDSPDKALYKAITSGHKYFLTKLLNVGIGNEDGEHENVEPSRDVQDDVVFEREGQGKTPPANVLSETQHKRLHALGNELYDTPGEWDEQRPLLVKWVSNGTTSSSKMLTAKQAERLIQEIEKKIAQVQAQKQPVPA